MPRGIGLRYIRRLNESLGLFVLVLLLYRD